jgi:hypothetical protein
MSLISYLNRVHFADGIVHEALSAEIGALKLRQPLFVCDAGLEETRLPEVIGAAKPHGGEAVVHIRTTQRASECSASDVALQYAHHKCDGIVALGADASMDFAKAIGLIVSHGRPLSKFAAIEGGITRIENRLPPIIAIPTTAGMGSEVGRHALIVVEDGRRLGFVSPFLIPKVTIYDPMLTLEQSAALTAATGMDAITHCVETFIASAYNPPADGMALDGLRRAALNIRRAVDKPGDLEARREMMAASLNGAMAIQKGLGGVHAISHALGGLQDHEFDHGTLNAILMPHVLEYNAPAVGERYAALKQAMGLPCTADLSSELARLARDIGLPAHLGRLGVDDDAVERAAPLAECDHTNGTNPRRASSANYRDIMYAAI